MPPRARVRGGIFSIPPATPTKENASAPAAGPQKARVKFQLDIGPRIITG